MARIRSVHARYAFNEELAALQPHTRLLHRDLPCHADKAGRLEDRPAQLRALVFPYEPDIDVDAALDELMAIGLLRRYQVASKRLIEITDFVEDHHPHHKESDRTLPAPLEHGASPVHVPNAQVEHTEPAPNLPAGCLSLVSCGGQGQGEGVDGCRGGDGAPSPSASSSTQEKNPEPTPTRLVDEYLALLPAAYLEVKQAPIGDVERFRDQVAPTFAGRKDTDVHRWLDITRAYLKVAGREKVFPYNWTDLPNLWRNWPQIEADAVKDGIVPPLDPDGRPLRTWKDDCRDANHRPLCLSEHHCRNKVAMQRRDAEQRARDEERQREIEAAGGFEAWTAKKDAERKRQAEEDRIARLDATAKAGLTRLLSPADRRELALRRNGVDPDSTKKETVGNPSEAMREAV